MGRMKFFVVVTVAAILATLYRRKSGATESESPD
jgi:hypothetical protein